MTRLAVTTIYTLETNRLTRKDVFVPKQPLDVTADPNGVSRLSTNAQISNNTTVFESGAVISFQVDGLDTCEIARLAVASPSADDQRTS